MLYSPWFLILLLAIPWAAWRLFARRGQSALRYSSVQLAAGMPRSLRQQLLWLPKALTLLGLLLLVFGLARPGEGREQTVIDSEGIAIELVVDRSSSMQAMDFQLDGENVDRLTAIKKVAGEFISGGEALTGRLSDLVGLVTFAGYADGITPPTLDHSFLIARLNEAAIVERRDEDGTAIGDAIALAVEKLNSLGEGPLDAVRSKVIVLLTDGENTAGELEPLAAAELAATMGIRIYTIGVGTQGRAPFPVFDPFSGNRVLRWVDVTIDEATLEQVASQTGGKYFRATDTDSLTAIYGEIDQLEKTRVETEQYMDYRELAVQSYRFGPIVVPPVLLLAFGALVSSLVLRQTWLRELN